MLPLIFGAKNVRENVGPFDFLARLLTWPQLGWRLHELSFRITEVSAVPPTRFEGAFVRPFVGDAAATFASLPPIGIPPQKVTDLLFHHVAESRAFLSGAGRVAIEDQVRPRHPLSLDGFVGTGK